MSPAYGAQVTSGVSFAQVSFTATNPPDKYSHYGQISVDFTMLYGEGYINVERYQNGQPAGWVVKNLPVISGSVLPGFSTTLDLGLSGYQSSFSAHVDFSPSQLDDDSSLKANVPTMYLLGQAEIAALPPADDNRTTNLVGEAGLVADDRTTIYIRDKECPSPETLKVNPANNDPVTNGPYKPLISPADDVRCFKNTTFCQLDRGQPDSERPNLAQQRHGALFCA
ncbi:MAG: hypothetical protein ACLPND_07065 [Candidatus Korobacteraceae bacterium]